MFYLVHNLLCVHEAPVGNYPKVMFVKYGLNCGVSGYIYYADSCSSVC